ncbi:MAG: GTP-binding protein, partial [Desulfobacterales bacterium]|nr:GTP-binding protein [Desulfobacterales bacterium]
MVEKAENLRNIALVAHGGAGKTSLAEVMLFKAGVTTRIGRVEDGNTVMDFEPEELKRTTSVSSGFHQFDWEKNTISLIDTPGDQNFFTDTKFCMQAADGVLVVVDAVDGVKVQTEQAWAFAKEFNQPRAIFINKLDRERAKFTRAFDELKEVFDLKPIRVQLPIGSEENFTGVVDLIRMKAYTYDENGKATEGDIPDDMKDQAESEKETLIEDVAEADDELIERYLEGETLSDEDISNALRKGLLAGEFTPVLCGSAGKNVGIDLLMNFIVDCMPTPLESSPLTGVDPDNSENEMERAPDPDAPFSAFVFTTLAAYAGRLSIFRVVSGTLGSDGGFYNVNSSNRERFSQLLAITGKDQKQIKGAVPGSIVAVTKLKETKKI